MNEDTVTVTIKGVIHYFNGNELLSPAQEAIIFLNAITINKLQKQIGELNKIINLLNKDIKLHIKAKNESDELLNPVRESLNKMTAEHGKLLRKMKRNK